MIFNEIFYENNQKYNKLLYVRQAGEVLEDRNYSISRSGSQTHTIGFLKSGALNLNFENGAFVLKSGQSIFLPYKISYTITAGQFDAPSFIWINLRGELIDCLAKIMFEENYAISKCDLLSSVTELKKLISSCEDCQKQITNSVFKMLNEIYSSKISLERENVDKASYEYYISNSIQSGFSVSSMAAHFHCSTDTVNRHFKKNYGITPYQYYREMCIEIAKTMLCKTDLTIEDIAQRLHFADRNHFSLYFKKMTEFSPAKYKETFSDK